MISRLFSRHALVAVAAVTFVSILLPLATPSRAADVKPPTIVLVHGAFADSSSWSGVVPILQADGYKVVAAANPLRSLSGDAAELAGLLTTIAGPVVLVGHSYGGMVITNAATDHANVRALVYVAALAPDKGESAFDLVGRFPGSVLGASLTPPVSLQDGTHDLFVDQARFAIPLGADLPGKTIALLAATQRPVTDAALKEAAVSAAWKQIPSWFIYGVADKSIPAEAHQFMAERAHARKVVTIAGGSHLLMLSHPAEVAAVIETAARSVNGH